MAYAVSAFIAVERPMPGQLDVSKGYLFCRMPWLCGHWPWALRCRWPGGQALRSVPQSPLVVCRHQLSTAACANTMLWLMPHLQAAQRRISLVVPVKRPLIRGTIRRSAAGLSPCRKLLATCWPVRRLKGLLTPLFSGFGLARTHRAHSAPEGSLADGGSVRKWTGAPWAGRTLGVGAGAGVTVGAGDRGGTDGDDDDDAGWTAGAAAGPVARTAAAARGCPLADAWCGVAVSTLPRLE